jgi:hypothetical protein
VREGDVHYHRLKDWSNKRANGRVSTSIHEAANTSQIVTSTGSTSIREAANTTEEVASPSVLNREERGEADAWLNDSLVEETRVFAQSPLKAEMLAGLDEGIPVATAVALAKKRLWEVVWITDKTTNMIDPCNSQ